jgi:putative restriction endonuclease
VRYWVANTDREWFQFLAARAPLDEVNFWAPNKVQPIKLPPGAPWLFKFHVRNGGWIVGGGFFAHYTTITPRFAWEAFHEDNGAGTFAEMVRQVSRYSERTIDPDLTVIGSTVLVEPFFLPRDLWVEPPADWSSNLTRGKSYESTVGEGQLLWERVQIALATVPASPGPSVTDVPPTAYGEPVLIRPRLGQGAFRVMVTDAYERRCVVTNERTLPVLEAAHIRPYAQSGPHEVSNGLLLRSDLHTLFDRGYVTVTPDKRLRVSRRIHEEFENGRDYYALDGQDIRLPITPSLAPSRELLEWHADAVFRG